jgi:hypothetical protein
MHKKAAAKTGERNDGKPQPRTNLLQTQPDAWAGLPVFLEVDVRRLYLLLLVLASASPISELVAADETKILLGVWAGKATGPDGAPPTGDITVTFSRDETRALKGKIVIKAAGGLQYSGEISDITVRKKVFSGTAVFKLGENPLQALVTGPIKGKTIQGTFSIMAKGEKIGEGTFNITKEPVKAEK